MKVVCGLKQKMDNESLSSCFSSPKKNYITRLLYDIDDVDEINMYVILKDYQTSSGFQLFKDDYVLKCVEHTFGLVGSNETSVTIPVFKEDRIIYNTFIGIPTDIIGLIPNK